MARAAKVCAVPGCPKPATPPASRCPDCRRHAERERGGATARGYGHRHRSVFRAQVLARDPICTACRRRPSTVADHWPRSRFDLSVLGLDPDDPTHGRGLCEPCHNAATATHQPGGWADRDAAP